MSNCDCKPPHNVLVGPGREVSPSARFTVSDKPIVIKAFGLTDADCVEVWEVSSVCGEEFQRQVKDSSGCGCLELSMCNDTVHVVNPGTYWVSFAEGDPGDSVILYEEIPDNVTVKVGGSSMSCCLDVKDVQSMIDTSIAALDDVRLVSAVAGTSGFTLVMSDGSTVSLDITPTMIENLVTPDVIANALNGASPAETLNLRLAITQTAMSTDPGNSLNIGSDGGFFENDTL